MPRLDFVFIGPGRSGTTFVDSVIRQDPRIALPRNIKETNFFLECDAAADAKFWRYYDRDCEIFERRGEVANMYFYTPAAAENLASMGEQLTLHSILRNPFDRLVSSLRFRLSAGEITQYRTFEETLRRHPDLVEQSAYYTMLAPYVSRFGDRLKVYVFEDITSNPEEMVGQFYANIGLRTPDTIPTRTAKLNIARAPRSRALIRASRLLADKLRSLGLLSLLGQIKTNRLVARLLYSNEQVQIEIDDWPEEVVERLNDEIDQLSAMMGRNFSDWKRPL